ncbi:type I phosphomannose isomerase catalytic subunit [Alkalicoccus halolimnae]|uniref:Mannose-6-phosphate isomerase n=1 Tax=Alkalicoccus halolimnae TaxID=1667239 RepID=A0A5C7F5N1_9BACI|nr:type I phosphomannose isomerase catalytic subunit [Alkalicoccus halolimnae]TXF84354.1 class I mannose-6-phosphate isomerase [Alkalicoccus halolimnae]
MKSLIRFDPLFKEKVWGGEKLKQEFGYDIPSSKTGECWAVSGHENGASLVSDGEFAGKTLRELWNEEPELFGEGTNGEFPLLVKLIDARDDLSIQVHPDNEYARKNEGYAYGKTECWYIVSADPGSHLVLGHHAETEEELAGMVREEKWNDLFRYVPIKAGDFVYVPSGTVHAIGAGIMLLEVQQSSDITYRFYDYDRPDQEGKLRELHIEDSIACSMVPHEDKTPKRKEWAEEDAKVAELIDNSYFSVRHVTIDGSYILRRRAPYQLITILEGEGEASFNGTVQAFQKGEHLLVPADTPAVQWKGSMKMIVAEPGHEA